MLTKLTLTVDKSVIEHAKAYAKATGRSLSEIIEQYLILLTEEGSQKGSSQKLNKIRGIAKLPGGFDEKKAASEYFQSKHR